MKGKCSKHPMYKGIYKPRYKPRVDCADCWRVYQEKLEERVEKILKEKLQPFIDQLNDLKLLKDEDISYEELIPVFVEIKEEYINKYEELKKMDLSNFDDEGIPYED